MARSTKKRLELVDGIVAVAVGSILTGLFIWALPETTFFWWLGVWFIATVSSATAITQARANRRIAYED